MVHLFSVTRKKKKTPSINVEFFLQKRVLKRSSHRRDITEECGIVNMEFVLFATTVSFPSLNHPQKLPNISYRTGRGASWLLRFQFADGGVA
eukprot:g10035.t1